MANDDKSRWSYIPHLAGTPSVFSRVIVSNLVQASGMLSDSVTFSSLAPTWFNTVALDLVCDQHLTRAIR